MKKILLIHTGGTFGMVPIEPTQVLAPGNLHQQINKHAPELYNLAEIDFETPFNLDSSNIAAPEWDYLANLIDSKMEHYDGFVIIHGTDTMVYTAAALSYTLRNLKKPVILTGSQRPLSKLRSDARENLVDAVECATMALPEVSIVFGQDIIRGNRAKKMSLSSYEAFQSPNYPFLGKIGLHIKLNPKAILENSDPYLFQSGFAGNVAIISVVPAMQTDPLFRAIKSGTQSVILVGFGAGNFPDISSEWISFIQKVSHSGIPVFIASHSVHGAIDLTIYESGEKAAGAGAIGLKDITLEASYVKLLKILSITSNRDSIESLILENWAGEISD